MISRIGVDLIEKYEGCKLTAYKCPAKVWTIGIGSTIVNGKPVQEGQTCTKEEALSYLEEHLQKSVYPSIELIKVPLTQNQIDALCSLIYNIGSSNFKKSTLLKYLNTGDYTNAADQFLVWNKAGGKILNGLTKRRQSERDLFLKR